MSGPITRAIRVSRILTLARSAEADARRELEMALLQMEREAHNDMRLLAAAAVVHQGGQVRLSQQELAAVAVPGQMLLVTETAQGFDLVWSGPVPNHAGSEPEQALAPPAPVPPANPAENDGEALVRIVNAIRTFMEVHYQGELQRRGGAFLVTVFGEMLALAVALERDGTEEPLPLKVHLERLVHALGPRVASYEEQAEALHAVLDPEPGEPAASNPFRTH